MTRAFKVNISAPSIIKDGGTSSQYLMADGSVKTGSATTSMNYAQTLGTKQTAISASGVTIVSVSITTGGNPVQVTVTGDAENSTAGGWIKLQLYRDSIAIGKIIHVEGSAGSENIPYALNVIDSPAAGTYTYSLKTASTAATGNFNFGETDGPVINAVELNTIVPSVNLILSGNLTANSIIKSGGTSSQFLKADGSIDSSAYLTSTTGVTTVNGSSGAIANVAKTDAANTFSTSQIITPATSVTGLTINAATSAVALSLKNSGTSSDLQQWYNSSGTLTSYIEQDGRFTSTLPIRTSSTMTVGISLGTTGATFSAYARSAGTIAVGIKGFASQTNDLTQWQDNNANILAKVDASGNATFASIIKTSGTSSQFLKADGTVDSSTYLTTTGSGTGLSGVALLASSNTFTTSPQQINAAAAAIGLIVKANATTPGNLQEWQDSTSTALAQVTSGGFMNATGYRQIGGNTNAFGASTISGTVTAFGPGGNAAIIPVTIRGAASQTADLQQWQNSSGSVLGGVTAGGSMYVARGTAFAANAFGVSTGASTNVGIIVRGETSQSADLQQWQNNSGTVLASLSPTGTFSAVSKSFDIPHPIKLNMRLRYGSLEGPENGVYIRGNTQENIIELPEYWMGLVDESTITVSLTSIGKFQKVYVQKIEDNKIYIGGRVKNISYVIFGERKDIDKLIVEY